MRKIRYCVAASLDGFIAGPNGEADWISHDPDVDFAAIWAQFDTGLMGRHTYEAARRRLGEAAFKGITNIVFSRTMKPQDYPNVTILSELSPDWIHALHSRPGKDIWLFGGGSLFRSFLDAGLVDTVEVNVIPVLLRRRHPTAPAALHPSKAPPPQPRGSPFRKTVVGL